MTGREARDEREALIEAVNAGDFMDRAWMTDIIDRLVEYIQKHPEPGAMTGPEAGHEDAWWAIERSELMAAMRRAHQGEDPELLYVELFANARADDVQPIGIADEGEAGAEMLNYAVPRIHADFPPTTSLAAASKLLDSFGYTLVTFTDHVDGAEVAALHWENAAHLAQRLVSRTNRVIAAALREAALKYREAGMAAYPSDLEDLADYMEGQ